MQKAVFASVSEAIQHITLFKGWSGLLHSVRKDCLVLFTQQCLMQLPNPEIGSKVKNWLRTVLDGIDE
ncbi:hypothetical protein B1207_06260 [Legionella quinlivanii]|uniref:Uncharacterized protein n=1 Tax=Legionella quinlivanii TaxID=45073 RepID=A0A364LK94_9GAMM|nr:hypothetical protein [Legionella quinlivanii]RAP37026.1 hypothetical protein B1207_06260 [Legionella quinlivanii]